MKNRNLGLHTLSGLVWIVGLMLAIQNLFVVGSELVGLGLVLLMTGTLGKVVAYVTQDGTGLAPSTGLEGDSTNRAA